MTGMVLKGYQAFSSKGSLRLPPVVVLHGLLGSSRNFGTWSSRLGDALLHKHDIYSIDLRHHAGSIVCNDDILDYDTMADDVYTTIESLNLDRVHVVGHSMGGKVAATMAMKKHEIPGSFLESLTMLDISPVSYDRKDFAEVSDTLDILKAIDDAAKTQSKEDVLKLLTTLLPNDSLRLFVRSNMIWHGDLLSWNFNLHVLRDNIAYIAGFSNPRDQGDRVRRGSYMGDTLVLKGEDSHFVQPRHHAETTALFPNARIQSISGAGHWLHIDRPQESAQAVADFIRTVTAKASTTQGVFASAASRSESVLSAT
jgi:esterase